MSNSHFCQEQEKKYFVFSDVAIDIFKKENICHIFQDDLGWPLNTLHRFKMFSRIENLISSYDYLIFFNANCVIEKKLKLEDIFPYEKGYTCCLHPGYFSKNKDVLPFEKREKSTAYISDGEQYFAGGLIGGAGEQFIAAAKEMDRCIDEDFSSGLMAKWHDESHWNRFILAVRRYEDTPVNILDPGYLYPDGYVLPFEKKIRLRDKKKYIFLPAGKKYSTSRMRSIVYSAKKYLRTFFR